MEQIIIDNQGRRIRLTDERYKHIIQYHPEVTVAIELIKKTIQEPEYIIKSNSDQTVDLYYQYYVSTSVGDKWLCVVVKVIENDSYIITVYFTDKLKKGAIIWKKH